MAERDRRRRLRVPKTAVPGEIIQIKCLAEHVMESGRRKHPETGELVPRFLINRMECRYNGELVFFADWFNGMTDLKPVYYLRKHVITAMDVDEFLPAQW